jgi:hypothetical protein
MAMVRTGERIGPSEQLERSTIAIHKVSSQSKGGDKTVRFAGAGLGYQALFHITKILYDIE